MVTRWIAILLRSTLACAPPVIGHSQDKLVKQSGAAAGGVVGGSVGKTTGKVVNAVIPGGGKKKKQRKAQARSQAEAQAAAGGVVQQTPAGAVPQDVGVIQDAGSSAAR